MRMFLNGVDMVCADNALILHRRSASFGEAARFEFIRQNRPVFDARWAKYYEHAYREFRRRDPLKQLRAKYNALAPNLELPEKGFTLTPQERDESFLADTIQQTNFATPVIGDAEVVFILPGVILGGGSLSVLQHANELQMRGVETRILSLGKPKVGNYPQFAPVIPVSVDQLYKLDWNKQKVVATFWTTAYLVKGLTTRYRELQPYYYVQDYEPWFYSRPEEHPRVVEAEKTYEFGFPCVAKTEFLRDLVHQKHAAEVKVITPGIDHGVFLSWRAGEPSRPSTSQCLVSPSNYPKRKQRAFGADSHAPNTIARS